MQPLDSAYQRILDFVPGFNGHQQPAGPSSPRLLGDRRRSAKDGGDRKDREINYPAVSRGVLNAFRHAGLDPASSLAHDLDTGFRRYDGYAASRGVLDPK